MDTVVRFLLVPSLPVVVHVSACPATTAALHFSHFFKPLHNKGIKNGADEHIQKKANTMH